MSSHTRSDMELWDRPFQTLLVGVLGVNILAHTFSIPWWVVMASGAALGWKLGHLYFGWLLPKRPMLYLLGFAISLGVVFEYKTMFGHEAATPILVFLASLKLLETNRDRDAKFIIVTSYFLLMAHLLYSQSLASTFFMAFDVALITILMYQLHRADRRVTQSSLRPVVRLLITTIPIWILLFMVFPRFSIKSMRKATPTQATGFAEGIDPGSVSSLAQTNELAFRVRFLAGPKRSPENLYWRGATLYDSTGMKWIPRFETETRRTSASLHEFEKQPKPLLTEALTYEIVTEASPDAALFALPSIVAFNPGNGFVGQTPLLTNDHLVRLSQPGHDHLVYTASSVPEVLSNVETMTPELSERTLTVPGTPSAEYQALVRQLKQDAISIHHAIHNLDEWFTENDFRYTLTPNENKSRTLDEFLFQSRKGFCEHYAAASATILRSMGFRTRVVVGYQGGKWNDVSNTLMVRTRDAHAWVEVWSPVRTTPGKGRWMTYDPTASIAPLRLRMGGDFLDLPEEQQQIHDMADPENFQRLSQSLSSRVFDQSMLLWDYAQMSWTRFLLNYDRSGQRDLFNTVLAWLGLTSRPWLISALITVFFGIMLRLIFLWHLRNVPENAALREWSHLEKEFLRIGAMRSTSDGPLTIRDRLTSETLKLGVDAFIDLQYGPPQDETIAENLRRLRRARREARRLSASANV